MIRSKTRVSSLATIIHYSFGIPCHDNQRRKRNKRNPNWKGRNKTVTGEDDRILYINNPKNATRKVLEPISEFYKVAEYRINTQKSQKKRNKSNPDQKRSQALTVCG